MFHCETVSNVFREGGELLTSSFCIFHVPCFPMSVRVIVFVAVLDGRGLAGVARWLHVPTV